LQQHRKDLVRVNNIAMLIDRANAVSITIRNQPRSAVILNHGYLRRRNMGQNRLRIYTGKRRVQFTAELHIRNTGALKNPRYISLTGTIHRVNKKSVTRLPDLLEVDKLLQRSNIRWRKIHFLNLRWRRRHSQRLH